MTGRATQLTVLLILLALPLIAVAAGEGYVLSLATRIVLFSAAAASLNLIMGYGAMPSMGHAAFFGTGAYGATAPSRSRAWTPGRSPACCA